MFFLLNSNKFGKIPTPMGLYNTYEDYLREIKLILNEDF